MNLNLASENHHDSEKKITYPNNLIQRSKRVRGDHNDKGSSCSAMRCDFGYIYTKQLLEIIISKYLSWVYRGLKFRERYFSWESIKILGNIKRLAYIHRSTPTFLDKELYVSNVVGCYIINH
jgi:hypothetical protein